MKEIKLPYRINSYLLINKLMELEWGDLYLSIQGNETEIKRYLITARLNEYFPEEFLSGISAVINEISGIKENLLWHPENFISESSISIINFPLFNSFSLSEILRKSQTDVVPLTIDLVLSIFSKVLQALDILHEHKILENRLIHGMPIPSHIFISLDGEVKLMNAGIFAACQLQKKMPLELEENLGIYIAPEQKTQFSASKYSDIYAVGVSLLETLMNKSLKEFQYENLDKFIDEAKAYSPSSELIDLPDELKKILKKALSDDPNKRYSSAEAVEKELDEYLFSGEYQPSTFNLAFYMSTLLRTEAEAFNKLMEETKNLNLQSYFKIEEEKIEIAASEVEVSDVQEVIELEESPIVEAPKYEKPSEELPKTAKTLVPSFEIPEKRTYWKPVVLALIVIIAGLATYFIFNSGRLAQKAPTTAAITPPSNENALELEREKRKELEKKFEEEKEALLQKIAELTKKLEQGTEEEKKAALQDIQKLKEVQKQKEEDFAKAIESLAPEKESKKIEEPPKPIEETKKIEEIPVLEGKSSSNKIEKVETKFPEPENEPLEKVQKEVPNISENVPPAINTLEPKEKEEVVPKLEKEIYELSELDEPIKAIKEPKVEYPPLAKRRRVEGLVILQLIINKDGKVESVKVQRGVPELNDAAIEAAKNSIYTKPKKNGIFVKTRITKVYNFKL